MLNMSTIPKNLMEMTTNTEISGSSKFKSMENDGFGASKARKLGVGELVVWDSWAESLETAIFEEKSGVILSIYHIERQQGWGYMAKIMSFGGDGEINLPLISLRKAN